MSDNKRFDEYVSVDCNDCANYWNDSCDGVQGSEKPCNSFLAKRDVVIPEKINELEKLVKTLRWSALSADIVVMIHLLSHLWGTIR